MLRLEFTHIYLLTFLYFMRYTELTFFRKRDFVVTRVVGGSGFCRGFGELSPAFS